MPKETTRFVYVTYIRAAPEKVFDAITQPGIAGQSILANSTADSRHSVIPGRGRRLARLLREQEAPRSTRGSRTARVRPPRSCLGGARLSVPSHCRGSPTG